MKIVCGGVCITASGVVCDKHVCVCSIDIGSSGVGGVGVSFVHRFILQICRQSVDSGGQSRKESGKITL